MKSKVYFSSLKNKKFNTPLNKITKLLGKCDVNKKFKNNDLTAIKVHFGELGNTSFLRPIFLRPIIDILRRMGTKPYLTDTNTLYIGMRTNSVDHLINANMNGFNFSTLNIPVIIADGLRGENTTEIDINLESLKKVKLANDIVNSDGMIVVSHFKGHEVTGIGGAIKNLSMGCASRQGKLEMHSQTRPIVNPEKCTSCNRCIPNCQVNAIQMKEKAYITEKCVGCARCIAVCPEQAINIQWNESSINTQKKMAEYAYGVIKALEEKVIYINVLTSISPACDCYPGNDEPVTQDIGFLSSLDPVAIDVASYDLIKNQAGNDPFKKEYPDIDANFQLLHAEKIGLGSIEYELIDIDNN